MAARPRCVFRSGAFPAKALVSVHRACIYCLDIYIVNGGQLLVDWLVLWACHAGC